MTNSEVYIFNNLIEVAEKPSVGKFGSQVAAEPFYSSNAAGTFESKTLEEIAARAREFGGRFKGAMSVKG